MAWARWSRELRQGGRWAASGNPVVKLLGNLFLLFLIVVMLVQMAVFYLALPAISVALFATGHWEWGIAAGIGGLLLAWGGISEMRDS